MRSRSVEFDWTLFYSTLVQVRWPWLAAATLIALASYFGRALRWAVMIRHLRPNPSLWGLFSATAIGFTGIVLFGRAGELIRPYLISAKEKVPFSSQMAAWLVERICDLLSALLIFGFALTQVGQAEAKLGPALQWVLRVGGTLAAIVGAACVLLFILLRQSSGMVRQRLLDAVAFLPDKWRGRVEELTESFVLGVECTRSSSGLYLLAAYTALEWGLIVLCYVAVCRAFPAMEGFGLTDVLILIGFVAFGSLVQIPGIGGGVQIATVLVLTEVFHRPVEVASSVALMTYIITFIVIMPVGLVLLLHEGLNWRKLKAMKGGSAL